LTAARIKVAKMFAGGGTLTAARSLYLCSCSALTALRRRLTGIEYRSHRHGKLGKQDRGGELTAAVGTCLFIGIAVAARTLIVSAWGLTIQYSGT
jgi:hypothetical protein